MSFDDNLHLAAKTIGLAPLIRLYNLAQKSESSEETTIPPPRQLMLANENMKTNDGQCIVRYSNDASTIVPWGPFEELGTGELELSSDTVHGGGLRVKTAGKYLKENHTTEARETAVENLDGTMILSWWMKLPTITQNARIFSQQGTFYVAIFPNNQLYFRFFGSPSFFQVIEYTPGEWAHYVCQFNGSTVTIIRNTVTLATINFTNIGDNGSDLYILARHTRVSDSISEHVPAGCEFAWMFINRGGSMWHVGAVRNEYNGLRLLNPGSTQAIADFEFLYDLRQTEL